MPLPSRARHRFADGAPRAFERTLRGRGFGGDVIVHGLEVGLGHRNPGEDEYYLIAQFCAAAPVYSVLKAFVGEMDAARLAGMIAAKNAEMARAPAATDKASGSQLETP